MSDLHLPVRPNLEQLRHQAKEFLALIQNGDPSAIEALRRLHPGEIALETVKLSDAQFVLARRYGVESWPRLKLACELIDSIWRDDPKVVKELVGKNPRLIHENARATAKCNWGPPMSYAANLGRIELIELLIGLGATDFEHALDRALLQGKIDTAELLHSHMGSPPPPEGSLDGPAYTLSVSGTAFALRVGAKVVDTEGGQLAPVAVVLETDSRKPEAKHAILEMYVQHGLKLPDTPVMALHRGRIDLLEEHLHRDPDLLTRSFTHEEIYPPELGCHDEVLATHGTPLAGTTLLHMCVDYDELEIAKWLIEKGMDVNARAAVDHDGFGGHTALFSSVVSQPNFWMNYQGRPQVVPFVELLLQNGAEVSVRASLRKRLHPGYAPRYDTEHTHEYRNVTAISWGQQFHAQVFVSQPAIKLIAEHGGVP